MTTIGPEIVASTIGITEAKIGVKTMTGLEMIDIETATEGIEAESVKGNGQGAQDRARVKDGWR